MAGRAPRASIVVAWVGTRATLERYLTEVAPTCHDFGAELVVVAPTVRPGNALFRARFGAARVIATSGELTAGPLRSRGVRAATGDLVLVLDDTRQPSPQQLAATLERLYGPGAASSRAAAPRDGAGVT